MPLKEAGVGRLFRSFIYGQQCIKPLPLIQETRNNATARSVVSGHTDPWWREGERTSLPSDDMSQMCHNLTRSVVAAQSVMQVHCRPSPGPH